MPQVKTPTQDKAAEHRLRVRNTRKVLIAAALIMSVFLLGSVLVTSLLIPPDAMREGGDAAFRALAYLAHGGALTPDMQLNPFFGALFGTVYDLNPSKVGQVNNVVKFASDYGNQIEHWNGVDFTMNARPQAGMLVQGGVSTGRTSTDNCEVRALVPEVSIAAGVLNAFCHVDTNFLTQVKLLGTYTVPKVDVQFSGTF